MSKSFSKSADDVAADLDQRIHDNRVLKRQARSRDDAENEAIHDGILSELYSIRDMLFNR